MGGVVSGLAAVGGKSLQPTWQHAGHSDSHMFTSGAAQLDAVELIT